MTDLENLSKETCDLRLLEAVRTSLNVQNHAELSDLLRRHISWFMQAGHGEINRQSLLRLDQTNLQRANHYGQSTATVCFFCPLQVERVSWLDIHISGELISRHELPCLQQLPDTLNNFLLELVAVCNQSAELIKLRALDQRQSARDPLTGLFNRKHFLHSLEKWVADERRFDLVLFGLNRFKRVNESLGHQAGDQILELVANQLSEIVEAGDILARVGGDEFAILTSRDDNRETGFDPNLIHARLAEGFEYRGEILRCYGSIGISRFPEHGSDQSKLLRCADHAMIAAKQLHTGTVWYDGDLRADSIELLALVNGHLF